MVYIYAIVVQLVCDATIPIPAMVFIIYLANTLPNSIIAIRLSKTLCVIIEC